MKKYKVEETTKVSREAKIEFPNWNLYPIDVVEQVIANVLKDMQIDLRFCINEFKFDTDPNSDYSILTNEYGFYIVKEHSVLTITVNNEFNNQVEI